MTIPELQIRQQYCRINLETVKPVLQIRQRKADLKISQPAARLEINKRDTKVEIDNYPPRRDLNLRNITDFRRQILQLARERTMEAIARYAENGDRLMRIEDKSNTLYSVIVSENALEEKELTLGWLSNPRFNVIPGELKIEFKERKVDLQAERRPPEYHFISGRVNINIEQYNQIQISLKGDKVDRTI